MGYKETKKMLGNYLYFSILRDFYIMKTEGSLCLSIKKNFILEMFLDYSLVGIKGCSYIPSNGACYNF